MNYDLEDIDGPKYIVVKLPDDSFSFKYAGHQKAEDDVQKDNLTAKEAINICDEHNRQLSKGIQHLCETEISVSVEEMTDHHGRIL